MEIRGIWITQTDSKVLLSRKAIDEAVDKLIDLKFNTLYPAVWWQGYTLYPSDIAKNITGSSVHPKIPELQNRDMLDEVIKSAKAKGMRVIPWFEYGLMTPAGSKLAKDHPNWLAEDERGETKKDYGDGPISWLNPLHLEATKFIVDLIAEVVKKYPDIDGIQLDDHFGLPANFGYNQNTVSSFAADQGFSPPLPYADPMSAEAIADKEWMKWVAWRAEKMKVLIKQVFDSIKALNKDCLLSLSPNPLNFSYHSYLADWDSWRVEGYVEELIVQIYRDDLVDFEEEIKKLDKASKHINVAVGVLAGTKAEPLTLSPIEKQIDVIRSYKDIRGCSIFFYESLFTQQVGTPGTARNLTELKKIFA